MEKLKSEAIIDAKSRLKELQSESYWEHRNAEDKYARQEQIACGNQ